MTVGGVVWNLYLVIWKFPGRGDGTENGIQITPAGRNKSLGRSDGGGVVFGTCILLFENSPEGVMERKTGFEPATSSLARRHSTTELLPPVPGEWCRGPESDWGHLDFQSSALPTELPRRISRTTAIFYFRLSWPSRIRPVVSPFPRYPSNAAAVVPLASRFCPAR